VLGALLGLGCLLALALARPVVARVLAGDHAHRRLERHGRAEPIGVVASQSERSIGPGTVLVRRRWRSADGIITAYVLRVDLAVPTVNVGLLYPGRLAAVQPISTMAARARAFAAVNGDFFNIGAAGAPIGPVVSNGLLIKSPEQDRALAVGVGVDGLGRVAQVRLRGFVILPSGRRPLSDLNDANRGPKAILAPNGIALFTARWGSYPLAGAVLGRRSVTEVRVRHGRVVRVRHARRAGVVSPGTSVLLGTGTGGRALSGLRPGQPVTVVYGQDTSAPVPFRWAIGGKYLLVRHGVLQPHLPKGVDKSRTAVGVSDGGWLLDLVVTVGADPERAGLSLHQLAQFLRSLGIQDAVALDDGGSTTMVARLRAHAALTLLNPPVDGTERAVANGIGVFAQAPGARFTPGAPPSR
jgi:Phosphodiester glycosidase